MASGGFDILFTKARPHILEKICLSLDYNSFKSCLEVNKAWKSVLTTTTFQKKAMPVFREEIMEDEKKLRKTSEEGNTNEVKTLLSIGLLDVDCVNERGLTPLHFAAKNYHKDVVQLLLNGGADPNKVNKRGYTPLYWSAKNGHKDVVQPLLDRGQTLIRQIRRE